jgi:hypothetical protein
VAAPLSISLWAENDPKFSSGSNAPQRKPPPPVVLTWSKYRGPGEVKFNSANPKFETIAGSTAAFSGKAPVSVTFSAAGEYLLHVTANDDAGEGGSGEVCCWTTAIVKVSASSRENTKDHEITKASRKREPARQNNSRFVVS